MASSAAQIELSGDAEAEKVVSQANQAFRDQIVNVHVLVRDAKAGRMAKGASDATT